MAELDRESFSRVVTATLGAGKWRAVAVQVVTETGSVISMISGDDDDRKGFRELHRLMGAAQRTVAEDRLGEEPVMDEDYWGDDDGPDEFDE